MRNLKWICLLGCAGLMAASCARFGSTDSTSPTPEPEATSQAKTPPLQTQLSGDSEENAPLEEGDASSDSPTETSPKTASKKESSSGSLAESMGFSGPIKTDQHKEVATALIDGVAALNDNNEQMLLSVITRLSLLGAEPGEDTPNMLETLLQAYERKTGKRPQLSEEPAYGPIYRRLVLAPGAAVPTSSRYFAGMISEVSIAQIQGDGAVLLKVYDRRNKKICETASKGQSSFMICEWTPKLSADYRTVVENSSNQTITVYLIRT